ncbi:MULTISPECIES: response regulator transcription factor [unclassified Fusibacter]|uniref:response regulator transcription factor n=1 Tax=unclassified Fusibacter TaxID=2624464 RepID=UPI001012329A|nr:MULTISPECIES: response regulator transcription factor [unclassified Fusibacter]MCK8060563.1 response regulator transcription factor [Fusibacter sp. A2]NPE22983.1 response regulator transcription factor [Fusibacter sp. A1]RXV60048.1 DNA-binding response regulator [Fusibacter sp. A1]
MSYRILVVEDEKDINELVKMHLEKAGFVIDQAFDGADAVNMSRETEYDMFLLDYMLPYMNGVEILKRIRKHSVAPVLFLTARTEESAKVEAFGHGADDYIEKPFSAVELVYRVKASMRRYTDYQMPKEQVTYQNGCFTLHPESYLLFKEGKEIQLNPKAFKLMEMLMSSPGRIFTKEQIYKQVWDEDYLTDSNTIMVHISQLREKIEENPKKPNYIVTIKGLGYRMEQL